MPIGECLGDLGAPVGGRVVDDQDLGVHLAGVIEQGADAALERVGAVVVDDDDRDQRARRDRAQGSDRLSRPLKIEMKSTAEITCRPRTPNLVAPGRASACP